MKKKLILTFIVLIQILSVYSNEDNSWIYKNLLKLQFPYDNWNNLLTDKIDYRIFLYNKKTPSADFYITFDYNEKLERYEYKKEENLIRRAEILFFGSLTFATFGAWLFFSIFNALIYNGTFGELRREQFLFVYLGSSVISISVVVSDLFLRLKPERRRIEIY